MQRLTRRWGLCVLALGLGCSYPPVHDPTEGAIHVPRIGQTDQYGRADDARTVLQDDIGGAKTTGRYGSEIDQLERLAQRNWASRAQHEEVDGIDVDTVFADLRTASKTADSQAAFVGEVRTALCRLGDMHFTLQEKTAGSRRMGSGLQIDAVASSFVVRGVDDRYDIAAAKPRRGDVIVKADGKPIAEWAQYNCLRPGSSPGQREHNTAQLFSSQWRLPEETVRPKKLTLRRSNGGTYGVELKWRSSDRVSAVPACVSARTLDRRVGILTLHTFACPDAAVFEQQLAASTAELRRVKDLVVDVRGNSGGDDAQAQAAARRLVADAPAWMRFRHHDPEATVTAFADQPFAASDSKPLPAKRIWLLSGPGCASTCEIFAAVLSTHDHVTVVGTKTAGGVGNPKPHTLSPSGLVVTVPGTEYAIPGTELLIEGHGIWPDVEVRPTIDDVAQGRDAVLSAAIRRIPK